MPQNDPPRIGPPSACPLCRASRLAAGASARTLSPNEAEYTCHLIIGNTPAGLAGPPLYWRGLCARTAFAAVSAEFDNWIAQFIAPPTGQPRR